MKPFDITETRYLILKELSKQSSNPKLLAEKLNMTLANISHQLKYLEATGFLKKERKDKGAGSRKNGDVRIIYSLQKELTTVININLENTYYKQFIPSKTDQLLTSLLGIPESKHILKYLICEETTYLQAIALKDTTEKEIHLLVITNDLEKFRNNNKKEVEVCGVKKQIVFWSHSLDEFKKGLHGGDTYYSQTLKESKILFEENKELTGLR